MEVKEKEELLYYFGLKVPLQQVQEVYSALEKLGNVPELIQKKNQNITKNNEHEFINFIKNQHEKLIQKSENPDIIQRRDATIAIRAINPQQIKSLTERAFFNSFNLERNALNDLNQGQSRQYDMREERKRSCGQEMIKQRIGDEEQEQKCICGKLIPGSEWVQCSNEDKCRGSNWYHLECAGFNTKDIENLKEKDFFCEICKRDGKDDQSVNSSRKRRKND